MKLSRRSLFALPVVALVPAERPELLTESNMTLIGFGDAKRSAERCAAKIRATLARVKAKHARTGVASMPTPSGYIRTMPDGGWELGNAEGARIRISASGEISLCARDIRCGEKAHIT